jgi:hypothetical protein
MARPSLKLNDYITLGVNKNMTYLGMEAQKQNPNGTVETVLVMQAPKSVTEAVWWECNQCHERRKVSYRGMDANQYGCSCQNPELTQQPEDYHNLARHLGICWAGMDRSGRVPKNSKTITFWYHPDYPDRTVGATWQDLAYGRITKSNIRELHLPPDINERPFIQSAETD